VESHFATAREVPRRDAEVAHGDIGEPRLLREGGASRSHLANRADPNRGVSEPRVLPAQAMRLPVWDKPGVIGCAENYPPSNCIARGASMLRRTCCAKTQSAVIRGTSATPASRLM